MIAMHQAVNDVYLVATRQQLLGENAADVPGAAGDQDLHRLPRVAYVPSGTPNLVGGSR